MIVSRECPTNHPTQFSQDDNFCVTFSLSSCRWVIEDRLRSTNPPAMLASAKASDTAMVTQVALCATLRGIRFVTLSRILNYPMHPPRASEISPKKFTRRNDNIFQRELYRKKKLKPFPNFLGFILSLSSFFLPSNLIGGGEMTRVHLSLPFGPKAKGKMNLRKGA